MNSCGNAELPKRLYWSDKARYDAIKPLLSVKKNAEQDQLVRAVHGIDVARRRAERIRAGAGGF
jgi:hypothetical protein